MEFHHPPPVSHPSPHTCLHFVQFAFDLLPQTPTDVARGTLVERVDTGGQRYLGRHHPGGLTAEVLCGGGGASNVRGVRCSVCVENMR